MPHELPTLDVRRLIPQSADVHAHGVERRLPIDALRDGEYICPAGEALIWRFSRVEKGLKLHNYWSSNCQGCALKSQCTPSTQRRVRRWEHQAVSEKMQLRLSKAPEMKRIRKRTVEHPFGTLKQRMGTTPFLTRKLAGEMSLNMLAYNLKRVMKIIGAHRLIKALTA